MAASVLDRVQAPAPDPVPLCVDLDGTLIRSDSLFELVLALLRRQPLYVFLLPFWVLRGKAAFKHEICARASIDARLLPYNPELLAWLRQERERGRTIWLCTGAHDVMADAVARHLGMFDGVLSTSANHNLSGRNKGTRLVETFGAGQFDYAGNAAVDLEVWCHARRAIVANARKSVAARAARVAEVERVFPREPRSPAFIVRALRIHQWLKNVLVFVPLTAAHLVTDPQALAVAGVAFLAFSLCASGVYVINDLLDLELDRQHPRKRVRPFAAGTVSIPEGVAVAFVLLVAAGVLSLAISLDFALVVATYLTATIVYSTWAKRMVMVDVMVLAALYTLRILAGTVAIDVPLSFWLLAFSMFLFLSLALIKRHTELLAIADTIPGRGYRKEDTAVVLGFGAASGLMSVLVLALYINSPQSGALYERPEVIWLLCPLLLYWISRMWLTAQRGEMHHDPIVFAITDRASLTVAALGALVVAFAL